MSGTERVEVGGIPVDVVDVAQVVARVLARCVDPPPPERPALTVFSCNVDMVVKAERDPAFAATLGAGSIVTADGMPIVWLARMLGTPLPERVTGVDLVPAIAAACAREGRSIFLLGAAPGVAARAAERLVSREPALRIAGTLSPPPGFDRSPDTLRPVLDEVRRSAPDVLFVALGAPRQERLALDHAAGLGAKVILGIGGAFDMIAGDVRRAPRAVQAAGAEWLWRLSREPRRLWRRYLVDDPAFARIAARQLVRRWRDS